MEPFEVWQLYGDDRHRVGCGYETQWLVNGGFAEYVFPGDQTKMFLIKLTKEGVRLRRYGSFIKYERMEVRKQAAEDRGNWKKVYWLTLTISGWVVGVICGILIDIEVKPLLLKYLQKTTQESILKIPSTKVEAK